MNKILTGITIFAVLTGWGVSFGKLLSKQKHTEEKVVEVKVDLKEAVDDIDENENINLQQMIILERVTNTLDKLERKLEK